MNQKIIDRGFNEKGRARKSLIMNGYEYFLIEPRDLTNQRVYIAYPNFQNTGMALCGCKKVEKK